MEKWMSKINDKKKLVLINIPGSHDSAAFLINKIGSCFAQTQYIDITKQLNLGVRIFDIRVTKNNSCCAWKIFDNKNNNINNWMDSIICCHGVCDCYHIKNKKKINLTYESVLIQIKNFLNKNPTETILVRTNSGRGNKYQNIQMASEIFDSILGDISIEYNNKLILGDVRGKVVYLFNNNFQGGTDIFPIHDKYKNGKSNFNEFKVDGELKVKEIKELLEIYNYTFNEAENNNMKLPLNYETSCTGEYYKIIPLPEYEANIVNKFLREFEFKKGYYYGWISIDFIDEFITKKIIESNFDEDNNEINENNENIYINNDSNDNSY